MAHNYGLLSVNNGLLWGIVAYYFGLLGVPGSGLFFWARCCGLVRMLNMESNKELFLEVQVRTDKDSWKGLWCTYYELGLRSDGMWGSFGPEGKPYNHYIEP